MSILQECPECHRKIALKNKRCKCGTDMDKLKKSRKVKFYVAYRLPGGKQVRELVDGENLSPYSIEDARVMAAKRTTQKAEKRILDVKKDDTMTFGQLSQWYLSLEKTKGLSSGWRVKLALDRFNEVFGNILLSQIRASDIENYQMKRRTEGRKDATIDQETGAARTAVRKAFNDGMISGDTLRAFQGAGKLLKGNANARDRVISQTEFESLMENSPSHFRPILATAYFAGMRKSEILNLTLDKVDLRNRVIRLEAGDTKTKMARNVPICGSLLEILTKETRILRKAGEPRHLFLYKGKPVTDFRKALKVACDKSGIAYGRGDGAGFCFHDLRHTSVTNFRKAGVPESVIMQIVGHTTRSMFDRYNKIDADDIQKAVDQMDAFLSNVHQTVDQEAEIEKTETSKPAMKAGSEG